ncbi:NifB/NifX family molybdenum-iron cluster-binding protein [Thiofaba sp. EF100]|uniref:NifB/NifX family molybdenum-iron cluster-binding protein n=1 Tax=Thiofaba sp. EF100 TaxID=3121274 RepID=UPI003221FEED
MMTETTQLIAVTSQNRRTVTGHAGRCRKFWLYPVTEGGVGERRLVELGLEESFHATPGGLPKALEGITALISQGMGQGMVMRLERLGIRAWITGIEDPDLAVQAFLRGEPGLSPEDHASGHDAHDHEEGDCGCGH